ncbi:MAG TPA: DmsE family decaheme c-type cytochrome [Rhizomicrobium sp.]|nr:DmsE family decaheme c-type cytochrome [Rhizomicrobium sp.]
MKEVRRSALRFSLAIAFVVIGLISLLSAAVVFHGSLHAWSPGRPDSRILAEHVARMRAELARIHAGKVDSRTLQRILAMHTQSGNQDAGNGSPDVPALEQALAGYLAGQRGTERPLVTFASFVTDSAAADAASLGAAPASIAASQPRPPEDESDRTYVGQKTCEGCHAQEAANWAHTIHAAVFTLNPRGSVEAQGCEACHGPGSAHVKNPSDLSTIISFSHKSLTPVARQNAQCLTCHKGGQRIFWPGSVHENNNLACSDCHNPMSNFGAHGLTARESVNETCFSCHKIQRTEFNKRSHMPLLEGKLTCVDCHNPHGSTTAPLLKADSVNEVCYSCHAEKRGPFLFEHAPVRESCLNCHSPHGSDFEALLNVPRPMLCQQCHAQDGHPAILQTRGNMVLGPAPNPMLISTSCQTCHVNIHGSNDPSGSRFER